MCDCFHMVLPTWPGAPGSASGRQLQPEEPEAETEDDRSVTEGPVDEIIRPRPQGSSPVYEYAAEGTSFGLPEDTPRRRASSGSGGRRSWWKRDSGDSRTLSRMSRPPEATEVLLTTEVEAGASGYSITGGGRQGIFVKQVLKDSPAAKLFSLREGDELLSATVFFDNIKYEDALKILQYSEPYRVQFQVRRKRPAPEDEDAAAREAQADPKDREKQDKDVADSSTETPPQTLEGSGDQERLLAKPREGRGRRAQKERLSWPKFQSITSKRRPGPRRSHSSSEADGRGDAPNVSPSGTGTEAQLPAEEREQKAGPDGPRRKSFLNLTFRMGSGKGPTLEGRPSRGGPGVVPRAGVVEEAGSGEDRQQAAEATVLSRREDQMAEGPEGTPTLMAEPPVEPAAPTLVALGGGASMGSRGRKQTKEAKDQEDALSEGRPGASSAAHGVDGRRQVARDTEVGIAGSAGQAKGDARHIHTDFHIQIPNLQTPTFKVSQERKEDPEGGLAPVLEDRQGRTREDGERGPEPAAPRKHSGHLPQEEIGGEDGAEAGHTVGDMKDGNRDKEEREERRTVLKFKIASFGWSARKEERTPLGKPTEDLDQEKGGTITESILQTRDKDTLGEKQEEKLHTERGEQSATEVKRQKKGEVTLGDKEVGARDSKFKMPKFKMPSFGASAPSRDLGTSVDVTVPKVGGEATLPSLGGEAPAPEGAVQPPAADIQLPGGELEVSVPEAEVAMSGLKGKAEGVKIKGQLPTVQMPSLKMPKVDIKAAQVDVKAPQVDIKAPKLDLKAARGEVSAPDVEVSLPSVEVDAQVPGARLDAGLSLGDKEVGARDSKFKMPKFKMPSFGVSAPSKSLEASVDASLPKVQAEVSEPSLQADVKTRDGTVELPTADLQVKSASLGLRLPEGQVPEGELQEPSAGAGLKGHLPKVQMPSIKMPKVDFKAPQVDIKAPKLDLKAARGEVSAPDVEVSLPSVEVDAQVPGAKLDADLSLGDKEVGARDSKFKMPKFKMPSFGASAPSRDLGTSVDVTVPKVGGEATLPSLGGEAPAPEGAVQPPAADIQLPGGELEVSVPEAEVAVSELKGKAEGVKIKGQLPTVQMPSLKMPKVDIKAPQVDVKAPQVDIKAPKLDLKAARGEVSAPDVEVSLPSVEVDAQVPGARLDAGLSLGDKEVGARDSKFKMPKFKMPSFGTSARRKSSGASMDASLPTLRADVYPPVLEEEPGFASPALHEHTVDIGHPEGELELFLPEAELAVSAKSQKAEAMTTMGPPLESRMHRVMIPVVDIKAPQVDFRVSHLDLKGCKEDVRAPHSDVPVSGVEVDAQVHGSQLAEGIISGDVKDFSAGETFMISNISISSSVPSPSTPSMASPLLAGGGKDTALSFSPGPRLAVVSGSDQHAFQTGGDVALSVGKGGEKSKTKKSYFKLPKVFSPPGKTAEGFVASAEDHKVPSPVSVSASSFEFGHGGPQGPPVASVEASLPMSMLGRLSGPHVESSSLGSCEGVTLTKYQVIVPRGPVPPELPCEAPSGSQVHSEPPSPAGAGDPSSTEHVLLSQPDGPPGPVDTVFPDSYGRVTFPKFHRPKFCLSLPTSRASPSPGGPGLPQGDPGLARSEGGVGGAGAAMGPPEGADVSLHVSEAPIPSLDFVQPDLSPGEASAQGGLAAGPLPLSKHGLSPGDSAQGLGLGAGSAGLLCGEGTAALAEEPLPLSLVAGSSEQGAVAGEALAGPRESWFRMPSLRLPSLRRAPKEWAGSAGAPGEGEAVAPAPGTEVGTAKSPQPQGLGVDGAAAGSPASSYTDVLRRNLDLRIPAGPSAPEVRVRPGAGSLPLQLHRPAPGEAGEPPLPAPGGEGLVGGLEGAEGLPSQPEGPLRLRACSTHVPSQVSVVSVGRVWEDSVLRVQIPKLKVPRFSFPAPSSEAVVFVPSVRELPCPPSAPDAALLTYSAGGRGARTPEAPPALGLPSEAAPICKVRVHIQDAEAASRQVAMHSTVTTVYPELSGPELFPTQIVRESEVPTSETQTPYGFSLLKGRVPEPPTRARVHVVPADRGPAGHREAQELVVPGPDPTSGDLQPDTGEPFEIICPSADEPEPAAGPSDLRPGRGRTDSCSDEEPAEILELLPEEDQETEEAGAADDQAPKARSEGKRSSGLFRFWLPSIGFSSSVSETSADSQASAQRPAPVQTQPEARPPPLQEKGGWFRFPKLGFSSSPTKKSKSVEEEASPAEENLQEEAGTFYDARESLSPEEPGAGEPAEVVSAGAAPAPQ